jgi:hypothetical protein
MHKTLEKMESSTHWRMLFLCRFFSDGPSNSFAQEH